MIYIIGPLAFGIILLLILYLNSKTTNKTTLSEIKDSQINNDVNLYSFKYGDKEIKLSELNLHKTHYYLKEAVKAESYLIAHGLQKHLKTFKEEKDGTSKIKNKE